MLFLPVIQAKSKEAKTTIMFLLFALLFDALFLFGLNNMLMLSCTVLLFYGLNKQGIRINVLWLIIFIYTLLVFILPIDLAIYRYAYSFLFSVLFMFIAYFILSEYILIKIK
jgi:hypothetical protein